MTNEPIIVVHRKYYSLQIAYELLTDNLKTYLPNKKLLVIGMDLYGAFQGFIGHLIREGVNITVIENKPRNVEWIKHYGVKLLDQDVRTFNNFNDYDCIAWSQGPEHFTHEDFDGVINKIKTRLIIDCPYGIALDSGYTEHISAWTPEEFMSRGFKTSLSNEFFATNGLPMILAVRGLRG